MRVIGLGGCRQGWVTVALVDRRFDTASVLARLDSGLDPLADSAVIRVDMQISPWSHYSRLWPLTGQATLVVTRRLVEPRPVSA